MMRGRRKYNRGRLLRGNAESILVGKIDVSIRQIKSQISFFIRQIKNARRVTLPPRGAWWKQQKLAKK